MSNAQAMWTLCALLCRHPFSIPCDPLCAHHHIQLGVWDFLCSACVNGLLLFVFLEMFQKMADGSLSEGHLFVLLPPESRFTPTKGQFQVPTSGRYQTQTGA